MIGLMTPNAFGEFERYTDDYHDFSILIDDWWTSKFTSDGRIFSGSTGETRGQLTVTFWTMTDIGKDRHAVQFLKDRFNSTICGNTSYTCQNISLVSDKLGIHTIDGKKAYQVMYKFDALMDDGVSFPSSVILTAIEEEDGNWLLGGITMGKSRANWLNSLQDSVESFESLREPSSYSYTPPANTAPTYTPPSSNSVTLIPYTNNNANFKINYQLGWLVEEIPPANQNSPYIVSIEDIGMNPKGWFKIEYYENGLYYSDYSNSKKINEIIGYEKDFCNNATFSKDGFTCKNFKTMINDFYEITNNYTQFHFGGTEDTTYPDGGFITMAFTGQEHHIGNEVWNVTFYSDETNFVAYTNTILEILQSFTPYPEPISSSPTSSSGTSINPTPPEDTRDQFESEVSLFPEYISVESDQSSYKEKMVMRISGTLNFDPAEKTEDRIHAAILSPDKEIIKRFKIDRDYTFETDLYLKDSWLQKSGDYYLVVEHDGKQAFTVFNYRVTLPPSIAQTEIFNEDEVETQEIPSWVKNNAKWWAEDILTEDDFVNGIQYMIKENIISIPNLPESSSETADSVPAWVKNNAGWWAEGQIDDKSFVQGIEYLVKVGIIQVS